MYIAGCFCNHDEDCAHVGDCPQVDNAIENVELTNRLVIYSSYTSFTKQFMYSCYKRINDHHQNCYLYHHHRHHHNATTTTSLIGNVITISSTSSTIIYHHHQYCYQHRHLHCIPPPSIALSSLTPYQYCHYQYCYHHQQHHHHKTSTIIIISIYITIIVIVCLDNCSDHLCQMIDDIRCTHHHAVNDERICATNGITYPNQ